VDAKVNHVVSNDLSERSLASPHRVRIVLLALGAALLLALVIWYFIQREPAPPRGGRRDRQFATTVGTALATRQAIPITLDALGTVTPLATSIVRAQVSGVLRQVLYKEGQIVTRGQLLAQIDPEPFRFALDQALGTLQRDTAQLEVAKVTLARDQTLLKQDSIAQQDVDTQAGMVKQLEGTVATDRANVATARLNLSYSSVVAPIEGRVGLRTADVGNYVTPGDAAGVATITQLAPIDVVFAVPSDAIARIQSRINAGPASQALSATVMDRTRSKILEQGQFLTLDNQVDVQTGTVRAKARFANAGQILFPNQFVNIRLVTDTLENAIVVPAAAIRHGPQGDFVYVVAEDKTVHVKPIVTGPASADLVSVASGLSPDERVVTEGGDRLVDGASITLAEDSGPPAARADKASQDKASQDKANQPDKSNNRDRGNRQRDPSKWRRRDNSS